MDSPPIAVPVAPAPPPPPSVPYLAALVPVAGGVALWLVTGSIYSLYFAAIGPLMIVASLVDGARSRRKSRSRAAEEAERAWSQAEEELVRRHEEERRMRWHRDPDVAAALSVPPLRGTAPPDANTTIVLGHGRGRSSVRTSGSDGERGQAFLERCASVDDVPVTVLLGVGVALRGPRPLREAAARAMALQLCLRFAPRQLVLTGTRVEEWGMTTLPHATPRPGAFHLEVASAGEPRPEGDAALWLLAPDDAVPDGITTVLDIVDVRRATLRTPFGESEVTTEFLSRSQATLLAAGVNSEVGAAEELPEVVMLADLEQQADAAGLPAVLGRGLRDDTLLDIVTDGPHAIVTGVTGSGKSELLVSWVAAIAGAHGPDRVVFVLADFKGGTAFEPLRVLPQVVAIITDLDAGGARRGVSSLTAELRRRESVIAAAGARDISQVAMPRVVIVVDEFAALVQEHGDLAAVFTDIAARGRALGMHLVLGTQRASGVIRDALAANCPLRVSLRVGDVADSRAVIGSDAAAEISGGTETRGIAFARRPRDSQARALRVALTAPEHLREIADRWRAVARPASPWLPPLPDVLPLADLIGAEASGTAVVGRADDPEHQTQPLEVLRPGVDRGLAVIGQRGSGRTSTLRAVAEQVSDPLWVPRDVEGAWDIVSALAEGRMPSPRIVLCDDVDAVLGELPTDYALHLGQLWEQLMRSAPDTTFVLSAVRAGGGTGRILEMLPRRAILRLPSRMDHLAAGGDADGFRADRPAGRARIGDREVQIAWVEDGGRPRSLRRRGRIEGPHGQSAPSTAPIWKPGDGLTAVVTSSAQAVVEMLADAYPDRRVARVGRVDHRDDRTPAVLVGEAEDWHRERMLWQRSREGGEVLVRAENATDLRHLAGVRELPPYARPHAGRAWSLVGAVPPRRVVVGPLVPGAAVRSW